MLDNLIMLYAIIPAARYWRASPMLLQAIIASLTVMVALSVYTVIWWVATAMVKVVGQESGTLI